MFDHRYEHIDENMVMIQANLDDMNPEYTPHVTELLLDAGANDVYWVPIIMKKGRPGLMINVLVDQRRREEIEKVIFGETTTLGLRYWPLSVHRLTREIVKVETEWGPVDVKIGFYHGELTQYAPEYEQCRAIAKQYRVPLKTVYAEVRKRYERMQEGT